MNSKINLKERRSKWCATYESVVHPALGIVHTVKLNESESSALARVTILDQSHIFNRQTEHVELISELLVFHLKWQLSEHDCAGRITRIEYTRNHVVAVAGRSG